MLRTSLTALISLLLACSPTSPAPTEAKPEVKPEAKPVAPAPEAASVPRAARPVRPPALAKGERRKLADQGDTTQRKAFWAAIQEGRKQTAGKDYAAAVAQFDAALAQLPDHPRALAGRGYARLLAGELDAAEADLRKALTHPGTAKVEAAIEFNLGLVAEKRGEADEAKRRFAIANKLRPSKAAADKLAGAQVCQAQVSYAGTESTVYANFTEIWAMLLKDGVVEASERPADEAAARKAVCLSVDLNSAERVSTDACAGAKEGPWLVTHQGDAWEHHLIEKGDGDQWRVTEVGYGGYGRCGQSDKVTLSRGEVTLVHRETSTGIVVDVMENAQGEMVDCEDGHDCTTACGEDDVEVVDYLFSPRNPDPVVVARNANDGVTVAVDGATVRMTGGGCDREVALVKP